MAFLASFLSFFSFVVSLGLFVFAVRFLFWSLAIYQAYLLLGGAPAPPSPPPRSDGLRPTQSAIIQPSTHYQLGGAKT